MTRVKNWSDLFDLNKVNCAAVLMVSACLRLLGIGSRPIWYDEAYSILQSSAGLGAIFEGILGRDPSGVIADQHPPGYFLALWGWIELWGDSVLSARLLSILFGVLTVWLAFRLGRLIVGDRYAWVPALAVAINPFHIHYSQEIRMYALMAGMLMLAVLALWKMMVGQSGLWWLVFGIAAAFAQYCQHLAGFFLAPLALIPAFRRDWKVVRQVVAGTMLAILLYVPWLINLPNQIASTAEYWVPRPGPDRFLTFLVANHVGLPAFGGQAAIGLAGGLLLLLIGVVVMVRSLREKGQTSMRPSGAWLLYLALVPPALLWLVSQVWPVYIERALLASVVCFALWIGWVIVSKAATRFYRAILVCVLLAGALIGIHTHLTYAGFPFGRFDVIGNAIGELGGEEVVVVHSNKLTFVPMVYHQGSTLDQRFVADPEGSGTDTLRIPTQEALGFRESESIEDAVGESGEFWLVIFRQAIEEAKSGGLGTHEHLAWANENYSNRGCHKLGDIIFCRFVEKKFDLKDSSGN